MIPRRLVSVLLAGAALASAALVQFVLSGASFSSASPAHGGAVSSSTDWVAPTQSSAVLAKTTTGTPSGGTGAVRQGGTYRIYATATDTNSGIASVTANVASLTAGQTAVAMTAGSYTVGGVTYNYASAEMTADASLSEGAKSFSIVATDQASNARTTSYSATVDNTVPSASMTDPGAYLKGTVTLGATASDTGSGLESLKIRIAPTGTSTWTTVCTTTTSPASCPLNTTTLTDGGYDVQALVTDNAGNTFSSTVSSRTIDNAAPSIARTVLVRTTSGAPEASTGYVHQGGTYRIYAQASDATSGLSGVTADASSLTTGQTTATMSSGSFTVAGQTYNYASAELTANSTLSEGAKTVTVRATDNAANSTTLNPSATVDNTAPVASMSDPGAYLKGTVTLGASGTDTVGIESLKIRAAPTGTSTWSDVCIQASSPASCSFNTTGFTDGGYDLQALVIDKAGNASASTVGNRTIDNTAPAIARTVLVRTTSGTPASSTGFVRQGGTYRIYAQASDATSGLSSVKVNASTITTGQTAATMTAGSYTVAGQSYNYASAELTANATLAEGAKTVTVTATDNATNAGTLNPSASVDNTAPSTTMNNPGAYLKGTTSLGATASDAGSLESLVIRSAPTGTTTWTTICTVASSPASCPLNTTTYTDGGYDFQSLATDAAGNTSTSTQTNKIVDNTAPVIARTVLVRTSSGTPASSTGYVKQGGTYKIYAQVDDATSGVASVAVNASSITTGQTAATMSSGSFTVAGQTYNYSSAELTANGTLAEGAKTVTVTGTDNATNAGTQNPAATVDNTAPTATMNDPGARIRSTVTLGATGSDGGALESIVIRRAPTGTTTWTTVCTVASSPASCSFDTTTVTDGGYDFQAVVTDSAGNTTTSTTVSNRIVDNTPPSAASIATTNGNKTVGKAESGDTIVYGFSEAMNPTSLLAGWNGTSTSVVLRIVSATPDAVQIWNTGQTTQLNFGSVALGAATNYATATANFNATMVMSGNNVTITLGTQINGTVGTGSNATMTWSPSTPVAPLDLAGNSMTTATRNSTSTGKQF